MMIEENIFDQVCLYLGKSVLCPQHIQLGAQEIDFCRVDEVAEMAYSSLRETCLESVAVMDDERSGEVFFVPVLKFVEGDVR